MVPKVQAAMVQDPGWAAFVVPVAVAVVES